MTTYDSWLTTEPNTQHDDPRCPTCRSCDTPQPTTGPDGLCFDCWSPNPYGNEAYDEDPYDDDREPPLDDDGPRGNGRIFL